MKTTKLVVLIGCLMAGCSDPSGVQHVSPSYNDADPLEPFNRVMLDVNEFLEVILIKPLALMYQTFLPSAVRHGVSNVFYNLTLPVQSIAYMVGGDPDKGFEELSRFFANSTFGIFGLMDASQAVGLGPSIPYDLDKAFAKMGIPEGPYIVLPILGGMTARHLFAFGSETFIDPVNIATNAYIDKKSGMIRTGIGFGLAYADAIDKYGADTSLRQKLDFYVSLREGYFQKRKQGQKSAYESPKISIED